MSAELVSELAQPLRDGKGWIKFVGILAIIGGVLTCLTIVGALVGWLPIWIGVILLKAAEQAEVAAERQDVAALKDYVAQISKYFKILGITVIVTIVFELMVFGIAFTFGLIGSAAAGAGV